MASLEVRLGELVKRQRKLRRLSQTDAAELLRVDQSTVSKWENGSILPEPAKLEVVAEFVGLEGSTVLAMWRTEAAARRAADGDGDVAVAASQSDLEDSADVPRPPVDKPRIAAAIREILLAINEDPDREGLLRTPERVAHMYAEIFSGLQDSPDQHLAVTFEMGHDEMVMVKDIPLYSMCEHHLIPFVGKAHVAYIPSEEGRITGLSKLARLVDAYARRPQVQEKLTTQIADEIERTLAPRGVLVVIEAEHLCISMRGVRKPGSTTVTSAVRGLFRDNAATRYEAMRFLHRAD